jgi:hypothetical protein
MGSSSHDCDEWTATTNEEKMEDVQITQSNNDNLAEQILLNPQSLPNRARTSNSKVAIVFLKEKNRVLSMTKFLRVLLPQRLNAVVEPCISLICARLHRDKFSNRGRSVGREKGSCAFMLGQMTLAIELCKIIGHQTRRQATCGERMPED